MHHAPQHLAQLPTDWDELDDAERLLLFRLLHAQTPAHELRTALLLQRIAPSGYHYDHPAQILTLRRPDGGKVQIHAHELDQATQHYAFLDQPPARPCPPSQLLGCAAIAPLLQEVPFRVFLALEFLWQNLLALSSTPSADAPAAQSPDARAQHQARTLLLSEIAALLYPGIDTQSLPAFFPLLAFHWLATLKQHFAARWTDLFRPRTERTPARPADPAAVAAQAEAANNAMLRALTRGDLTKEAQILELDTWRALEELNQLAREAQRSS